MADKRPAKRQNAEPEQAPLKRRKSNRREQQRAIDTRRAILEAALNEFAERGFDGASTRRIGERAGLDHTLITYHYRTKDALWKAVTEYCFSQIETLWNEAIPAGSEMSPADRVRIEFKTFLRFSVEHTAFHHFMLHENQGSSPRMSWLVEKNLSKTRDRIIPQIRAAQQDGKLIGGDANHVYYMLVGMTTVLSSLKSEVFATSGLSLADEESIESYWDLVERAVFK